MPKAAKQSPQERVQRTLLPSQLPNILTEIVLWETSGKQGVPASMRKGLSTSDWRELLSFGEKHRLSAYVDWAALRCGAALGVSESSLSVARQRLFAQASQLGKLTRLLTKTTELLKQENIAVFPLKGAHLAFQNYPHALFRFMSDIDILVAANQAERAAEILQHHGFQRSLSPLPHRWHAEIHHRWSPITSSPLGRQEMKGPDGEVDLHWDPHYMIAGEVIRFKTDKAFEDPCFFFAHLVVHATHSGEESGLLLSQVLDVGLVWKQHKFCATDVMLLLRTTSTSVKRAIQSVIDAGKAMVLENELGLWWKLSEPSHPAVRKFPLAESSWQFFRKIKSPKDKLLFLLGYFFRPKS